METSSPSELVLLVDDEPGILTALANVLTDEGYRTVCTQSGEEALELYRSQSPDVVFLDVWLPDRDGLETLQALREADPAAAVVMMSGHGTVSTAAKAIKMGAVDYLEKPLSYNQAVETVRTALDFRRSVAAEPALRQSLEVSRDRLHTERKLLPPTGVPLLRASTEPQRTIAESTVLYGLGLHSGGRTGMVLQPLPEETGIHFVTLPTNTHIPAFVGSVAETDYATTLSEGGASIKTVEHLLSALHALGITNLLIKVHGEIPVLDGSSFEFCRTLHRVGLVEQVAPRREIVIDRKYELVGDGGKRLTIEPSDDLRVSYVMRYPPPIGEQRYDFGPSTRASYEAQIAPARTFGFMRDLKMMSELGLGTGGRLDNCILVGEDNVINTELRFPDEFARHKILDIIGDLYLLGFPLRAKVTAYLTGHRDNIAIMREILRANQKETQKETQKGTQEGTHTATRTGAR
ncbi:MAG: UDP-3-O-acyl-N-acetylglucosamine deacetylase [Acidobacteriota bacterium]|nr:UDP-3-O-acyl-N-acetylglucosamine deacetylase [Acidobacteriota bacterium]